MKKIIGLMAAVAMLVGMLAGPAAASDAGVYTGTASVAQDPSNGCGVPSGHSNGLGLPVLTGPKTGSFGLNTAVTSLTKGAASLNVCGLLGPVAGIGAACGMSNGHSGSGTLVDSNGTTNLNNVGWPASVGGTLPVTGKTTGKKAGTLVSVAQAQGAAPCVNKSATSFTVVGAYVLLTGV